MPELPEVETIRRGLEKAILGKAFTKIEINRPNLRGPIPPALKTLEKRICVQILRRGKYMLFIPDKGPGFALHLGMSGRVSILSADSPYKVSKHDHIVFRMVEGAGFAFNDARRFGMVFMLEKDWEVQAPFSLMGPEPLEPGFTGAVLRKQLGARKGPIKTALLDQAVVSGVGNIYASEALFHAGIHPDRPAGSLDVAEGKKLATAIRGVLNKAIKAGGSTLKDYRHADGSLGYFQHLFSVYDREGQACPGCSCDINKTGGIVKKQQAGRSTFYCPRMQT